VEFAKEGCVNKKVLAAVFAILLSVLIPLHADPWNEKTSTHVPVLEADLIPSQREAAPATVEAMPVELPQTSSASGSVILIAFAAGLLGAFMRRSEPAAE
jgi:hypothetical protein